MERLMLQSVNSSDMELFQRKIELMVEMNNKKVLSDITNLNQTVSRLNQELSDMKKKIESAPRAQAPAPEKSHVEEGVRREVSVKKEEPAPKPRYGDYQPGDVDITKFFYFGNKK